MCSSGNWFFVGVRPQVPRSNRPFAFNSGAGMQCLPKTHIHLVGIPLIVAFRDPTVGVFANRWSIRHSEINQITFALPILVFLPRFRDRSFGILPSLPHFATARRFASGIYCRWTMKVLSDGTLTLITFAPGSYASFKIAQWTFQPEQS